VLGFEPMTYGSESECATYHYTTAPHTTPQRLTCHVQNSIHVQPEIEMADVKPEELVPEIAIGIYMRGQGVLFSPKL